MLLDNSNPLSLDNPLNRGLVSAWLNLPMRAIGGGKTLRDLMGQNHFIANTAATGAAMWKPSISNRLWGSVEFLSGGDNYLQADTNPTQDITEAITMSFRMKSTGSTLQHIFAKGNNSASVRAYQVIQSSAARFILNFSDSTSSLDSTIAVNDGVERLITCTYDGADMRIYLNGLEDNSKSQTGSIDTESSLHLYLALRGASTVGYEGRLDDIRLYDRALSAGQVMALYRESQAGYPNALNWIRSVGRVPVAPAAGGKRFPLGMPFYGPFRGAVA